MKFGESLRQRSVPQWRSSNIEYSSIKGLIKENTTSQTKDAPSGKAKAVAIPGKGEGPIGENVFEDELFGILRQQHARVSLFVKSKDHEVASRIASIGQRLERFQRHKEQLQRKPHLFHKRCMHIESETLKVGKEIHNIKIFNATNHIAIRKLLKKYRKWTSSPSLGPRVEQQIIDQSGSFTKLDLASAERQYSIFLAAIRTLMEEAPSTPDLDRSSTSSSIAPSTNPSSTRDDRLRSPSPRRAQEVDGTASMTVSITETAAGPSEHPRNSELNVSPHKTPNKARSRQNLDIYMKQEQRYWNEYDDPQSDADDGYYIYVNPDEPAFPLLSQWTKNLTSFFRRKPSPEQARNRRRSLRINTGSGETSPLLDSGLGSSINSPGSLTESHLSSSSSNEDDSNQRNTMFAYFAPNNQNMSRRITDYGTTLVTPNEQYEARVQRSSHARLSELCVAASCIVLAICATLAATSRRRMRRDADVAVCVGVVASLVFAIVGIVSEFKNFIARPGRRVLMSIEEGNIGNIRHEPFRRCDLFRWTSFGILFALVGIGNGALLAWLFA